jgi:glycosyltransferase involved in cell wall biosynthesis
MGPCSDNDFVSVVIPTHNRAELVKRAVQSVLNQSYANVEIIVVDDGSSDDTSSALEEFITAGLIRYIRHDSPQGASAARNSGIMAANGKYITGLDDDDIFEPSRIEELINAYEPNYSFVYSYSYIIRNGRKFLRRYASHITLKKILYRNLVGNQILTERRRMTEIGGFDTELPARQDHDMWTRLIERFGQPLAVKKPLMIEVQSHNDRISSMPQKVREGASLFFKKHSAKMDRTTKKYYAYYIMRLKNNGFAADAFLKNICMKVLLLEFRYAGIFFRAMLKRIKKKACALPTNPQTND